MRHTDIMKDRIIPYALFTCLTVIGINGNQHLSTESWNLATSVWVIVTTIYIMKANL